jgi:hypothetical protein
MPTTPQDHKTSKTFSWRTPSGEILTIVSINAIKGRQLRKYRKLDPLDMLFSILEDTADKKALALIDDLERADLDAMFEAWQNDDSEGATLGES